MNRKIRFLLLIVLAAALLLTGCDFALLPEAGTSDGLTVFFIDVGQADSALVLCGREAMLIDGGNSADSDLIYAFLRNQGITHLDYIVATHAHEDHVGGLAGALSYAAAGAALSPVTEFDSGAFDSFVKYLGEQGVSISVPRPGDGFRLGGADVVVVGVEPDADANNSSIVLKITFGATSFLFTGDAEREAEQIILDSGIDIYATVLKVGHHGSDSSTTYPFLREVMPKYAVISCGEGNSYGHPHENLLSRLRDADVTLFRTDMQGTIKCVSDGSTVSFSVERGANARTNPTEAAEIAEFYIGNVNSRKFHAPDCLGLPDEKNSVILDSREAAISGGYNPCGICKP